MRNSSWMQGYNYLMARTANPFEKGTHNYEEWLDGWTHRFRGIPIDQPLPETYHQAPGSHVLLHSIPKMTAEIFVKEIVEPKRRGRPPGSGSKNKKNG